MDDYTGKLPPLMEDLMNVLNGMQGGEQIALKLSKYVTGTFGKLFNNYTNIDINNALTVFSIRDVEEALKTPAMFNVLNFIWSKVRSVKKQRLLVCDEAWIMLQNDISANFLFGLIKRARKYLRLSRRILRILSVARMENRSFPTPECKSSSNNPLLLSNHSISSSDFRKQNSKD